MKKRLWHLTLIPILMAIIACGACAEPPLPPTSAPPPSTLTVIPAEFQVLSLSVTPREVTVGEAAAVEVRVRNIGGTEGVYIARLAVGGEKIEERNLRVAAGATGTVAFQLIMDKAGVYEISVNGLRQLLRVALAGQTSLEIHKEAWLSMLSQAETDKYYKYAIYASRILAVKHPEVYLQGDDIFAEVITTTPGLKQSYETKDVHSKYFYERQLKGDRFSFNLVDFSQYRLVNAKEIYPPDYPFLPFLDRRLAPIATSLKTFDSRITQFEKVVQLYFKAKEEGAKELFLIYCDNENAYLYWDGSLLWAQNREPAKTIEGNPILIFNERHVWYPLMDRDDTGKSELLKKLVGQYGTDQKEPQLTDFERTLLGQLKKITKLDSEHELALAKSVSILHSYRLYKMMSSERKRQFHNLGISPWSVWRAWMEKSALLSPISAYLAATAKLKQGRTGVEMLCNEYLQYTKTSRYPWAHGHVWQCGMYEGGPEDAYRTRAGHCVVQAANIGAALRLAGIDYYRLAGFAKVDEFRYSHHDFVYIPGIDVIISNGRIRSDLRGTVIDQSPKGAPYKYLSFIEYKGKWASGLGIYPKYRGTLSPKETLEIINYLRSIHNDDIATARIKRFGERRGEGELEIIPFDQLNRYLEEQQRYWSPSKLP